MCALKEGLFSQPIIQYMENLYENYTQKKSVKIEPNHVTLIWIYIKLTNIVCDKWEEQ